MAPTISPATATDLPAILELLRASGLPADGLADALGATVVARERDHVVGCAALELYDGAALLRSVAVAAERRGEGLGQKLTRAALEVARVHGAKTVYLLTETAGGFFPKLGFRAIGRDEVDPEVKRSIEFTSACPAGALVMRLAL